MMKPITGRCRVPLLLASSPGMLSRERAVEESTPRFSAAGVVFDRVSRHPPFSCWSSNSFDTGVHGPTES